VEVGPTERQRYSDDSEVIARRPVHLQRNDGTTSLVKTSLEPAGTNRANGGVKIETGLDANGDGVLDATEVDASATTYACNISPSGTVVPTKGINVTVADGDVSTSTTEPITVRFRLKDDKGFPVDIAGQFSVNTPISRALRSPTSPRTPRQASFRR
jgi:hypothetical protein